MDPQQDRDGCRLRKGEQVVDVKGQLTIDSHHPRHAGARLRNAGIGRRCLCLRRLLARRTRRWRWCHCWHWCRCRLCCSRWRGGVVCRCFSQRPDGCRFGPLSAVASLEGRTGRRQGEAKARAPTHCPLARALQAGRGWRPRRTAAVCSAGRAGPRLVIVIVRECGLRPDRPGKSHGPRV